MTISNNLKSAIVFLICVGLSNLWSQSDTDLALTDTTDTVEITTDKRVYGGLYLHVGQRPVVIEPGVWRLQYIDESPSMDRFFGEKELKAQERNYFLNVGFEGGKLSGGHFEIGGSFMLGEVNTSSFHIGWGLNFFKSFIFRPVIAAEFGNLGFKIGDIENNDLFINVNNNLFYDDRVKIKAVSYQATLKPRVDLGFFIGKSFHLTANVGYSYRFYQLATNLKFSGTDAENQSLTAKESINASNVAFTLDDNSAPNALPFNFDGWFGGIGIHF